MSGLPQAKANEPGGGELASLQNLPPKDVQAVPADGSKAPSSSKIPLPNGKLTLVVFLRHCGCPFAEKTFKSLATISQEKPEINCIAISHSSEEATERWVAQVGGTWDVTVVVDSERDLYAQWGLGLGTVWTSLGPSVLWSAYKLGTTEGIWNRPTESGSRWQTSGAFAVDRFGNVCWKHVSKAADDVPDLEEALQALLRK